MTAEKMIVFWNEKIYDRITRHDAITRINQENLIKKETKKRKILLRKGIFSALAIISDTYTWDKFPYFFN